jgi:hypothetical protein
MNRRKPRVVVSNSGYRLVQNPHGYITVEMQQGQDSMGKARWMPCGHEGYRRALNAIGRALGARVDRKRKHRAEKTF